jgi:hypothetical protein
LVEGDMVLGYAKKSLSMRQRDLGVLFFRPALGAFDDQDERFVLLLHEQTGSALVSAESSPRLYVRLRLVRVGSGGRAQRRPEIVDGAAWHV